MLGVKNAVGYGDTWCDEFLVAGDEPRMWLEKEKKIAETQGISKEKQNCGWLHEWADVKKGPPAQPKRAQVRNLKLLLIQTIRNATICGALALPNLHSRGGNNFDLCRVDI